jgi:hypothetical protein
MRPLIFAAALAVSSILGACIAEPSARDAWSERHPMSTVHELRSSPAAERSPTPHEGPMNRREALRAR